LSSTSKIRAAGRSSFFIGTDLKVTEPSPDCQWFCIRMKERRMEFLTFCNPPI
jgi:hypothetical protein